MDRQINRILPVNKRTYAIKQMSLQNIILSKMSQSEHILHLYELPGTSKSTEKQNRLVTA